MPWLLALSCLSLGDFRHNESRRLAWEPGLVSVGSSVPWAFIWEAWVLVSAILVHLRWVIATHRTWNTSTDDATSTTSHNYVAINACLTSGASSAHKIVTCFGSRIHTARSDGTAVVMQKNAVCSALTSAAQKVVADFSRPSSPTHTIATDHRVSLMRIYATCTSPTSTLPIYCVATHRYSKTMDQKKKGYYYTALPTTTYLAKIVADLSSAWRHTRRTHCHASNVRKYTSVTTETTPPKKVVTHFPVAAIVHIPHHSRCSTILLLKRPIRATVRSRVP